MKCLLMFMNYYAFLYPFQLSVYKAFLTVIYWRPLLHKWGATLLSNVSSETFNLPAMVPSLDG